ncbi:MAG: rRNA maturation RNase YbeY [Thioploca sp.]|nr:rRNA maturation RNase YbeY [Thioploca sp.]
MTNIIIAVQYVSDEPDLPDKRRLTKWVNTALRVQSDFDSPLNEPIKFNPSLELTIRIVDAAESQQLNEAWRKKPGPTNVLSFPFENLPGITLPILGDIVICAPLVIHEATQQQKLLDAHWAHLVIHGTLHLLGYDHLDEVQAQQMEQLEIQALHHLGYPNPYYFV